MKTWKKALALVLALAMVIPGVYLGGSKVQEVKAETGEEKSTVTAKDYTETWEKEEAEAYLGTEKEKRIAPSPKNTTKTGYVFAGLFNTEKCTLAGGIAKAEDIKNETVYAKFVPAEILSVKAQSTPKDAGNVMRFVSSVDTLNYSQVGFEVTYKAGKESITKSNISNKVFKRIESKNENINYEFSPKVVDFESDYFITATLDIENGPFDGNVATPYTVKAFWETLDGTRVRGASRYVSVADCRANDSLNLTFTATGVNEGDSLSFKNSTVGEDVKFGTATVVAVDGNTVHVKVGVNDKAKLPSLTKFTFTAGGKEVSAYYRNLYTQYTGEGTEDTTWYEVYGQKAGEYVIATSADLYGFSAISQTYSFSGDTVYAVANIEANSGTATGTGWDKGTNGTNHPWTPVGKGTEFAGTFDGGNNTISGIYVNIAEQGAGLFRSTAEGSTIRNLRVENSYIGSTYNSNWTFAGSVVGSCGGNLVNVYSDAVVKVTQNIAGGLAGEIWGKGTIKIEKCWFAGSVNGKGLIGGIAGAITQGIVTVDNCLNTGTINGTGNGVGGLCGRVYRSSAKLALDGSTAATTHNISIKNSLNVGNVASVSNAGSIIGWIQHISVANMSTSNVYATNESCIVSGEAKPVGNGASYSNVAPTLVPESSITGAAAYFNKVLDYSEEGAWALVMEEAAKDDATVENSTPVLKTFADIVGVEPTLPDVPEDTDVSWYEGLGVNTYTICNSDSNAENVKQLYGFAYLVNQGVGFDGMTVKLGKDVTINKTLDDKPLDDWDVDTGRWKDTGEDLKTWTPIGTDTLEFAGTFDGNMKTISGIFVKTDVQGAGLFRNTAAGSTIENLKLVNSYIWSMYATADKNNIVNSIVGSIVGSCGGNLNNIYSSAYVRGNGSYIGGIAGEFFGTEAMSVDGCWFNGTVGYHGSAANAGGIVGVVAKGTITMVDCLNTGTVKVPSASAGGLVGRTFTSTDEWMLNGSGSAKLTIRNCLNTGVISGNSNIGSAIGWAQANKGTVIVEDFVYATPTSIETKEGGTSGKLIGAGSVNGEITPVNAEELVGAGASGFLIGFDFTENGKWALIDDGTPQLRAFATGTILSIQ